MLLCGISLEIFLHENGIVSQHQTEFSWFYLTKNREVDEYSPVSLKGIVRPEPERRDPLRVSYLPCIWVKIGRSRFCTSAQKSGSLFRRRAGVGKYFSCLFLRPFVFWSCSPELWSHRAEWSSPIRMARFWEMSPNWRNGGRPGIIQRLTTHMKDQTPSKTTFITCERMQSLACLPSMRSSKASTANHANHNLFKSPLLEIMF